MTEAEPTEADLKALGLYDPSAPYAQQQLELLRYLISLGSTTHDLIEYRDELPALGTVLIARPGLPVYTREQVVEITGLTDQYLARLWQAAGFADAPEDAPFFSDEDIEVVKLIAAAGQIFGEDAVLQLSRVVGSSLARIADAAVSAFLVNIELPLVDDDPVGMGIARANVTAGSLLPGLSRAMDVMLRHHIIAARRSLAALRETGAAGFEVQRLCVGFIDLVGSTALAQKLPAGEFGRALSDFESLAYETITNHRGRLVKLIGDEVMFVSPDASAACRIALEVSAALASHPVLPAVRAGIAYGEVLSRDGDYFGPLVNLAARIVKEGATGTVAVTEEVRRSLGQDFAVEEMGHRLMKGLDEEPNLFAVRLLNSD